MPYTTQAQLRAAFWRDNPGLSRRLIRSHDGKGPMHVTDTRVAWCDYIDAACRAGDISPELADRATLQPRQTKLEFEILADHGHGRGWELETTETTRAEARARLREYRENAPAASYKLRIRRTFVARGE